MRAKKKEEPINTIRDGYEQLALEHSVWGPSAVDRAVRAEIAFNGETHQNGVRYALRFFVNKLPNTPAGEESYEAWTPYRTISYLGPTAGQALATMLHGVAQLGYQGNMHPDRPSDKGAPPIQHAINILVDRLKWQTERREEKVHELDGLRGVPDGMAKMPGSFERDNQIIAALGTAIASLGRVNDL